MSHACRGNVAGLGPSLAALAVALAGALIPGAPIGSGGASAAGRTTLFVRSFVNSNDIRGLAAWQGALALATDGGLVLHDPSDGSFRKILRSPRGLPSNRTLCVAVSPSGSLWIGTADHGLGRLKQDGSFRRALTSFDGLPSDRVQAIYVHGDSVWVGTSGGVALFTENPGNGQVTLRRADTSASTGGALPGDDARAFVQLGDTLWCGTTSGLASFAGGWEPRTQALSLPTVGLAVFADTLWAATPSGPYRYDGGAFTAVAGGHVGGSRALWAGASALYSGADAAGVFQYAAGAWSAVGSGLPAAPVPALLALADGSLWAGTPLALARYASSSSLWTLRPSDGPPVDQTQRAAADARGVWFTTDGAILLDGSRGAVIHYDGAHWTALTAATTGGSFQPTDAYGILSDGAGRIWIGHCCSDVDPRPRVDRFDPSDSSWTTPASTNLYAFAESPSLHVFGASVELGNGVYEFDRASGALLDSLTTLNTHGGVGPGLASNNLRGIAIDRDGKGWFAHAARGVDIWDGKGTLDHADDVWTHIEAGFPSIQMRALVVLSPVLAWAGTTAGVVRLNGTIATDAITATPTTFHPVPLPSGQVNDLAADPAGNLWIATTSGLARVDGSDGNLEVFTIENGLVDDDIRALAWDALGGALWVGTARGISMVVPARAGQSGFSDATYLFPNPLRGPGASLKLGGITNVVEGEIRDLSGALVKRFRCDPLSNEIWDLRRPDGTPAPSGVYLILLRDRGGSRVLRAAVIR